eukprot:TRINITY_DN16581_c0_g1_i1.p1 TRINITY_DN16581_c0_g1~~TRINITY_DN16581_c0_g1_i1.p1  ORF type:complete len:308 (+),score=25.66 TRINITY_DN16581_c0_g1_i1:61-984(+)
MALPTDIETLHLRDTWVRICGLGSDTEYNGATGRYLGTREKGLVAVELSGSLTVLVDGTNVVAAAFTRPPGEYHFDMNKKKTIKTTATPKYFAYTDPDSDEIIFSGFKNSGRCTYTVNHSYRPECLSAEFFIDGRESWAFPHVRMYNGSQYKNVPLPKPEEIPSLVSLMDYCGVPHNKQRFQPGESVQLLSEVMFHEGDSIPRSSHAKVLQKSETDSETCYEICVANGDRVDVPTVSIMRIPVVTRGDTVFLHREVAFESKRDPVPTLSQLSISSRGEKGMLEAKHGLTTFDVSDLWVRRVEGEILE